MNSQVRSVEGRESVAEVLCIEGNPQLISNLECVSASSARAIVILSDTDMSSRQAEGDACAVSSLLPPGVASTPGLHQFAAEVPSVPAETPGVGSLLLLEARYARCCPWSRQPR